MSYYLNIGLSLRQRLENHRAWAEKEKTSCVKGKWSNKSYCSPTFDFSARESGKWLLWCNVNLDKKNQYTHIDNGVYFAGFSHHILNIRHTGYFADQYQDNTISGIVFCVRKPGHKNDMNDSDISPKFIYFSGHYESENDSACIDFSTFFDDEKSAAICADDMARYAAEESREYSEKDTAKMQIDDMKRESEELKNDIIILRDEMIGLKRCNNRHLIAWDTLRSKINENIRTIKRNNKQIEKLTDNYWLSAE